ncbi:copper chaperone PCu(A)C [Xanthobacter dioxanivorans]|uniref:Copper chaperone PCu(A)C n=1 Tax=Xanthobacter dioxanivorans TaxID=2528964 RepID=A0A974PSA0_9HYPH|nr:copper chaperone PCu(A)C [Xanthobacter dioxanivorans]
MSHFLRFPFSQPRRGAARPFLRRVLFVEEMLAAGAFALCLLMVSAQALLAHEFKAGAIEIGHPWSRATPGGASVAAGYFVLKNTGAAPDRLVSATVPFAGRAEIHEMAVKDGVMTMRPLPAGIEVPAGGTVALKPGSYHLMFLDLKAPLKEGTLVDGTLTFEKAGTVAVQFKVEGVGAGAAAPAEGSAHKH